MHHGENTGKDQQVPPSRNGNQGHGEKLLALQGHLPMGQGGDEIQEGEPWMRWPRHRGRHCRGGVIGVGPFLRLRLPDIRWSLGPTWLLRAMGQGLLDCLRRHFGNDAEWMFAVAAPRAARHCAFKCIEHCHTVSCLSVAFPGLALSLPPWATAWSDWARGGWRWSISCGNTYLRKTSTQFSTGPRSSAIPAG